MLARFATSLVVVSMVLSLDIGDAAAQTRGRGGSTGGSGGSRSSGGSMGGGSRSSGGGFGGGSRPSMPTRTQPTQRTYTPSPTRTQPTRTTPNNNSGTWTPSRREQPTQSNPTRTTPTRTRENNTPVLTGGDQNRRGNSNNNSWTPVNRSENRRTRTEQTTGRTVTRNGRTYSQDQIHTQRGNQVGRTRTVYQNRTRGRDNGGSRTVVVTRQRNYQAYRHHNRTYYRYRPVHYYHPHFYAYCYRPLYTPWSYSWGWYSYPAYNPWYGYYGYYYRPWATYAYPSYWMTDYIIAEMLQDRYDELNAKEAELDRERAALEEERREISEETKKQIAAQVEKELKARENQNEVSLEEKLADPNYLFALSETIEVAPLEGGSCKLSQGDLIRVKSFDAKDEHAVMTVVTSQAGSCKAGSTIYVSLDQLQEFDNEFSARVDDAVEELESDPELSQQLSVKPEKVKTQDDTSDDEVEYDTDDMYPPTKKKKKKN